MTARVKKVIEEMAGLSPGELAEVADRIRELRAGGDRGPLACRAADLSRLFENLVPDPEFADDIEAGVRERRAMAESRVSPWER